MLFVLLCGCCSKRIVYPRKMDLIPRKVNDCGSTVVQEKLIDKMVVE
jgi:hypothetical protein